MGLWRERAIRRRSGRHHRAHPARAATPERSGSRIERRSGCRHVIHEQHTGAAHVVEAGKCANHVSPPRFARQRHLGNRIAVTDQVLVQDRHGQPPRQLSRDERALVEAALTLTLGAQGYGYERIDIERVGQRLCRNTGKRSRQISLVVKLEPKNRISQGRLVEIAHEHMVDAPFLVTACGALVAVFQRPVALATARTREKFRLRDAYGADAVTERAASSAYRREDDVREAVPQGPGHLADRLQRRGA